MEELRIDPSISYDVVELPSRGIPYPNKKKSLRVSYLTAADENILSAPNLVQSNGVIKELLRKNILDRDINVDDLVDEDRQAVLIFLRNTSFGGEYKVSLIDPKTKLPFESVVDLSSISYKDFTLVEDSKGEFPYHMDKSNVDITFKFLTKKQDEEIELIRKTWNSETAPPTVTKELEFLIKSINGNTDMMAIRNFSINLPIKDSQDFRSYVNKHKPGLNLEQQVIAPSGEEVQFIIGFGVEFFRPFYGV